MNDARLNLRLYGSLTRMGRSKQRQTGMTLLELLISMTLGLLLLTGIGAIFVGSNQTYRVQEQNARIQEAGRYALDAIGRSLRQAGYANIPLDPSLPAAAFAGATIDGTANTVTLQYDGTGGSDCSGTVVAEGAIVTDAFDLTGTDLRCNNDPLVSNVEDLQFLYGVDTDNDQSANQYTTTPGDWNQVVSVRACILVRSQEQGITNSDQQYLTCNGALGADANTTNDFDTGTDGRLRRAFVATFGLRNRVNIMP